MSCSAITGIRSHKIRCTQGIRTDPGTVRSEAQWGGAKQGKNAEGRRKEEGGKGRTDEGQVQVVYDGMVVVKRKALLHNGRGESVRVMEGEGGA